MKQKMKIQRLKEAWKNPTTNGVFQHLQSLDVPWQDLDIAPSLDIQYHFNRSGEKIVAPLISSFSDNENELTTTQINTITNVIFNMYSTKWAKLYELLSLEFNPISNYDMTEEETIDRDTTDRATHTGTQGTTHTGTETTTHTGTQSETHTGTDATAHTGGTSTSNTGTGTSSGTGSNDTGVYGFNSASSVPDTEVDTTTSASSSTTDTETFSTTLTDTRTANLTDGRTDNLTDQRTDNLTEQRTDNLVDAGIGTEDVTRTLTRSGNIGVTTSQQMIQSSIDLWQWNFFETVFNDIDSILTIQTY